MSVFERALSCPGRADLGQVPSEKERSDLLLTQIVQLGFCPAWRRTPEIFTCKHQWHQPNQISNGYQIFRQRDLGPQRQMNERQAGHKERKWPVESTTQALQHMTMMMPDR